MSLGRGKLSELLWGFRSLAGCCSRWATLPSRGGGRTPPCLGSWHTCQATGGPQKQPVDGSRWVMRGAPRRPAGRDLRLQMKGQGCPHLPSSPPGARDSRACWETEVLPFHAVPPAISSQPRKGHPSWACRGPQIGGRRWWLRSLTSLSLSVPFYKMRVRMNAPTLASREGLGRE